MNLDVLADLEAQALASQSSTVPDAWFGVMVKGDELLELVKTRRALELLRAHKAFRHIVSSLRADREDWLYYERSGRANEEYPGESRDRREAHDLALELLGEMPWL